MKGPPEKADAGPARARGWLSTVAAPALAVAFAGGLLTVAVAGATATSALTQAAWLLGALTIALWGTLATLLLRTRSDDARARLFAVTATMVAATIVFYAVPYPASDGGEYTYLFFAAFIYMLQPAVIVHMCGTIPERNELFRRMPWLLPLGYALSVAFALAFFMALVNAVRPFLPWHADLASVDGFRLRVTVVLFALSGLCGLGLLGYAAYREPTVLGRRQVLVVFVGLLPWTLNLLVWTRYPHVATTSTGSLIGEITVLLPPIALFVSIAGYRLFEVSSALRRTLIYGGSIGLLLGIVVIAFEAMDTVGARVLGTGIPQSMISVLLLAGGMLGQPLIGSLAHSVDRRFFREREALRSLRRRLITSLAEQRTLEGVSNVFVQEMSNALARTPVTLYLADPDGPYRARASTGMVPVGAVLEEEGARPGITIPIRLKERAIGLVQILESDQWRLDASEVEVLEDISHQASAMLENVRLLDLASNDPLTRLPRRHIAEERLSLELLRSRRATRPFAVALADIDHFKNVNDTYGHKVGDRVLAEIAQTLAMHSRRIDVVARWGGEEFMLIFPETDAAGARLHAEKLRQSIEQLEIAVNGAVVRPTISFGLCVNPAQWRESGEVIAYVDAALYRAKAAGRNQVVVCSVDEKTV